MTGKHVADSTEVLYESDAMTDVDAQYSDTAPFISWIRAAAIRAIKTAAQAALGALGAATAIGEADWRLVAGTAGLGAIASVLTSLVGLPEANEGKSVASIGKTA